MNEKHLAAVKRLKETDPKEAVRLRLMRNDLEDAMHTLCQEQAPGVMSFDTLPALLEWFDERIREMPGAPSVCCQRCGSTEVQEMNWVLPNENKVVNDDAWGGPTPYQYTYCAECDLEVMDGHQGV